RLVTMVTLTRQDANRGIALPHRELVEIRVVLVQPWRRLDICRRTYQVRRERTNQPHMEAEFHGLQGCIKFRVEYWHHAARVSSSMSASRSAATVVPVTRWTSCHSHC